MKRRKFLIGLGASGAAAVAIKLSPTQVSAVAQTKGAYDPTKLPYLLKRRVTHADRKLAASNRAAFYKTHPRLAGANSSINATGTTAGILAAIPTPTPGGIPDYFGSYPNYSLSPILPKFVDSLPGLTSLAGVGPGFGKNNINNYLPIAAPDTTSYPGSDYYEIGLVEYSGQFHSKLGKTKLRGYVQLNTVDKNGAPLTDLLGNPVTTTPHYLGPVIVATKGRPVRVKFTNKLATGTGGNLFIPVDTTVMGAGTGYNNTNNTTQTYTQNRATLHLHGGNTPWISDGTAHQWTVPVGETSTTLTKGTSSQDVPDMPPTGVGELTFYWTNQQSGRLMFYHDHAYGITRLNVYAGEAAGYLLTDPDEASLVADGSVPPLTDTVPLVIQDKTFLDSTVNTTLANGTNTLPNWQLLDPTWPFAVDSTRNDLWFPHVYMPNQNPYDFSGANAMGRWDYGPWFWPPMTTIVNKPTQANPYYDPANPSSPPIIPATPSISIVPEGFMDTPIVNGQAYPYVEVEPKAYRFMILNACNDRFLNLQLYKAQSQAVMWNIDGTLNDANAGEVKMVPASNAAGITWPADWPTRDGRDGGFPDPAAIGPNFIQIGTEGGLLPAPVTIPNRPVGYDYNRRNIVVLNVLEKALFLGPAERADTIIDFSAYAGQTIILYNDAPAPVPAFDPRNDYYTGAPDQTSTGGAPTTVAGYGPNTRTIMQIRVKAAVTTPNNYKSGQIAASLPAVFAKTQDRIIVLNNNYNSVYGVTNLPADSYVRIQDTALASTNIKDNRLYNNIVNGITLTNAGTGYVTPPVVTVSGGNGLGATAVANMVTTGVVQSFNLLSGGAGYTVPPTVTLAASPAGVSGQATARAILSPTSIASIAVTNGGSGYTTAPTVNITGGGGTGATATAVLKGGGAVASITITNGGSGYNRAPTLTLSAPPAGGVRATATATIARRVTALTLTNGGTGYTTAPTVNITGGAGTGATATAAISGVLNTITVGNGGTGYRNAPTVNITGGGGTGATASATVNRNTGRITAITITNRGSGYTSAPTISFTGGGGTGATATAAIINVVVSLTLTSGGTGYTGTPTVSFTGGGGTGAAATATVASAVNAITLTNAGSGYTTAPTVTFNNNGTGGTGATATATLLSVIGSITVTNPGSGYTSVPTISFNGGGGTGAVATALLNPTSVAGITVVVGGSGYTTAPAVTITSANASGGGAAAISVLAHNGTVGSVTVTNGGGGFLTVPTVTFSAAPAGGVPAAGFATIASSPLTMPLEPKAIQELFDMNYGRMNAILGTEIPNTTGVNQTTLPNAFIDPPNEIIKTADYTQPIGSTADGTQIWKITHNGVDTHAIHWHLMNVQVINRVGWDGAIRVPDANELGWKETVRMNPLEDIIVALRPYAQNLPWDLPNSVRYMDPTQKAGGSADFTGVDPNNLPAPVTNDLVNFGWEYTWHCHLLGHEENDMMRPIIFGVAPKAPTSVTTSAAAGSVTVNWTSIAKNATGFTVQRATAWNGPWTTVGTTGATTYTYQDKTTVKGTTYFYRVIANNVVGYTKAYPAVGTTKVGYPNASFDSTPTNALPVSAL